jgi:hypothetical protein
VTESRSLWGLRLLALALAGLAWFIFSGEKREPQSEKVVEAAVRYDAPRNFLLLERVETVRITGLLSSRSSSPCRSRWASSRWHWRRTTSSCRKGWSWSR